MAELYQDLLKDTSESKENGNYFLLTITDLVPNTTYPIEFRYLYKDKTVNDNWSAVKVITTPGESEPNTPNFADNNVDISQPEKIIITWDGTSDDASALDNYDRVDVYIDGLPFDGTKAAYSFKAPGTAIIPAPAGTYQIVLYAISKTGIKSPVSSPVTKTVTGAGVVITSPEDPDTPTIRAGLASVIVSWSGKKSGGADLTSTGFAGARVYIGTTSGFTPSDNNWVHTLNFANGSNQVSIGVGTVINKSTGATLAYGTPYYIKLGTVNASGATTGNYIAANPTNVTVNKLPASEISTGILSADASITAGAESGARVVMSGASSPFVIYGTNGTTKLLEFIGGSTGTLSINGGGTFTGNLSVGSGNSIFKAEPATGIWLGNAAYASAPFSVSNNGVIKAEAGTIGGWTLGSSYLQGTNIKLDTSGIVVGATSSSYFDISPTALTHRNANGTASGKFTLTLGASPQLTIDGTLTVGGSSVATSSQLSGYATTTALSNGLSGKISNGAAASDINSNTTTISGGKIATGQIASTGYSYASGNFSNAGMEINLDNGVIRSPQFGIDASGNAFFKGALSAATGTFSGALSAATGTFSSGSIGGLSVTANTLSYGGFTIYTSESGLGLNYSLYDTGKGMRLQHLTVGDSSNNGTVSYPLSSSSFNVFDKATFNNSIDVSGSGSLTLGSGSIGTNGNIYTSNSSGTATSTTVGAYLSSTGYVLGRRASGAGLIAHRTDSNGNIIQFLFSGSAGGFITGSTSTTPSFTGTSDYRAKKNIEDYSGALDLIKQTNPKKFIMKNDPLEKVQVGFIAHEFAEVFPDFVFGEKDAVDEDGNPEYQSLSTTNLIPYLMAAVKELSERLDVLEA